MTRPTATPKVVAYAAICSIGLLAAVVFGEVAVVGLAAPFGLALVLGLVSPVASLPEISVNLDRCRLVEGDTVIVTLELAATEPIARCDVAIAIAEGMRPEVPTTWSLPVETASSSLLEVPVHAERYGRFVIGPVTVRVPGLFGLLVRSGTAADKITLEVRPRAEALATLVRAREVRATAGDRLGRQPGDGIEFAEVRSYSPGTPGRLNWRVTARRGEPYVTLRHPERSTDLILLVDTFSAASLARQVRAAAGLAAAYLARHDRVGLVAFGGVLHWVEPAMGQAQLERLVAALTATEWHHSYAWKSAEAVPSRALPASGLVIAISPLDDNRMLNALATIRARGVDLAVVETIATPARRPASPAGEIARRIIELERSQVRDNFAHRGVPIVAWREGESLEVPLNALAIWRRRAHLRVSR